MAKIAISYLRCSTPEQVQGDSIRRQIEAAEDYAAQKGYELDRTINFHDEGMSGYSGANRTKGKLGLLLDRLRRGLIPKGTALLVENIDRISREHPLDSITLIKELVTAGMEIHTITNGQVITEARLRADFSCMLMLTFELGRGCGESERKSYLLSKTWKQKRAAITKKKLTSICPQWLELNKEQTAFNIIEDRAQVVREIFKLSDEGYGKRRIAARLNTRGAETWGRGKSKGTGWHPSYVSKILKNRAVLGEFQPHRMNDGRRIPDGDPIPDYFPAVIDMPTFERANAGRVATGGQTQKKVSNLFAGLVYEEGTDYRMIFSDKGKDRRGQRVGGNSRYLRSDRHRIDPNIYVPCWNYSAFENLFLRVLRELDWQRLRDQQRPAREVKLEQEIAALETQIRRLNSTIDRIIAAIANEEGEPPVAPMAAITRYEVEKKRNETAAAQKRKELRIQQQANVDIAANLDSFKALSKIATEPHNIDLRLRLREEIRRKVRRIELYASTFTNAAQRAHPWLDPSHLFILFNNGSARIVYIQPAGRGKAPHVKIADAPSGAQTRFPRAA
jgi:DNA invertase Pin-like site-specific DNA recombinase